MKRFFISILISIPFISVAQFKNVELPSSDGEVSSGVAISQKETSNITISSSSGKMYFTEDSGTSWSSSSLGKAANSSTVAADKKGDFYAIMQDGEQLITYKAKAPGKEWEEEGIQNFEGMTDFCFVSHLDKGDLGLTVLQGKKDGECTVAVKYYDGNGKKWSDPLEVTSVKGECAEVESSIKGSSLAYGNEDQVYAVWLKNGGKICMDRSYDKGKTWLRNDIPATDQVGGSDLNIDGVSNWTNTPVLKVDRSATQYRGSLYMAWTDMRGGADNADVYFISTRNRGDYWSVPVIVNTDQSGKHQFMPAVASDATTGIIYVLFYDRRDSDNNTTDVYIGYSIDGGNSFINKKVSEKPIDMSNDQSCGLDLAAHEGVIVATWTGISDGKTKIMASVMTQQELVPEIKTASGKKKKK